MRTVLLTLSALAALAGCGGAVDAQAAFDASRNIINTAQAGKAAAAQCKADPKSPLCPKVEEAFDSIAQAAEGLKGAAEKKGAHAEKGGAP
jgi:hypothetical protein